MTIPSNVSAAVTQLSTDVTNASPLESSDALTLAGLKIEAQSALATIDAAAITVGSPLDTLVIPGFGPTIVTSMASLLTTAADETTLADMRGYVGRAAFNIGTVAP